jgi:N-methylhydantoinase A
MTSFNGYAIGVDVGGTHTDVQVAWNGRLERGKALTDYADFSRGLLRAIEVAADRFEVSLEELLAHTETIFNATTIVTNSISELRGDPVGVIVTAGFKDTFRLSGGPRLAEFDDHLQVNVPDLVDRRAIIEIGGRMSAHGVELVPLDLAEVDAAVDALVRDRGVDALAVCLLSSYANPAHEEAVEQRIRERHPRVFVSSSHRLFPVMRETRRWTTAVLNCFVQSTAETYLDTINRSLAGHGFTGTLAFFQGLGAGITAPACSTRPASRWPCRRRCSPTRRRRCWARTR